MTTEARRRGPLNTPDSTIPHQTIPTRDVDAHEATTHPRRKALCG